MGEGLEPPADPEALTAPGEALSLEERVMAASAKVVDFGNACWVHKQFTSDIQTRQYRCPEVRTAKTSRLLSQVQRGFRARHWSYRCEGAAGLLVSGRPPKASWCQPDSNLASCSSDQKVRLAMRISLLESITCGCRYLGSKTLA